MISRLFLAQPSPESRITTDATPTYAMSIDAKHTYGIRVDNPSRKYTLYGLYLMVYSIIHFLIYLFFQSINNFVHACNHYLYLSSVAAAFSGSEVCGGVAHVIPGRGIGPVFEQEVEGLNTSPFCDVVKDGPVHARVGAIEVGTVVDQDTGRARAVRMHDLGCSSDQ